VQKSEPIHVNVDQTAGCNGAARIWQRPDGVQIGLLWAVCGQQEIDAQEKNYAIAQAAAPTAWRNRSALGTNVDLVQPAPGGRIWRFWLQGDLNLAIETTCGHLTVGQCAGLAVPAARYLAARLTGKPLVTATTVLFPPVSSLLGALVLASLMFVGANRLGGRSKLGKFHMNADYPMLRNVGGVASRLRSASRRRWWGKFLSVIAVLLGAAVTASIIRHIAGPIEIDAILAILFGVAGGMLLHFNHHPLLSRDRPYHLGTAAGVFSPRRLVSFGVTLLLGLLSLLMPLAVAVGWLIAGLTSSAQDLSSVLAGLVIAAVAGGYFIDRAAQRLRARNAQESMRRDTRPALLYLRNFGDDAQKIPASRFSRRGAWQRSTAWLNPIGNARFEEVFTRALARGGPIIAVGPAGGKLRGLFSAMVPTLGAAKTTLPHDAWQAQVREWAVNARAVVVSATPRQINAGFAWELDMLAREVRHGRIILVFGTWKRSELHHNFGGFISEVEQYPLFAGITAPWLTDGVLILIHVPADGWGTWRGWGAERRTAWTYTAAVGEAMAYAETAWAKPSAPEYPLRGVECTEAVDTALRLAGVTARRLGQAVDTRTLLLAAMDADPAGRWDRIWLHSRGREAIEQAAVVDRPTLPDGQWNNIELTGACVAALRAAVRISQQYQTLPLPLGVLVLGLIADQTSAAARALDINNAERQQFMADLIQDDLLGVSLSNLRLGPDSQPSRGAASGS